MSSSTKVLVSGYSEGFFIFDFNTTTGHAGEVTIQNSDKNLSFTVFDKHKGNLYCVHEIKNFNEVKEAQKVTEGDLDTMNTGAVSRWKLSENGTFERKQVIARNYDTGQNWMNTESYYQFIMITISENRLSSER